MKKIKGWILIICCTILLLIFTFGLILSIGFLFDTEAKEDWFYRNLIFIYAFFLVVIFLLILGLRHGLKRIKKDKVLGRVDYPENLKIVFKGKVEYKDYRNLVLGQHFKKPYYWVFLGILFYCSISYFATNGSVIDKLEFDYSILIFILVFLLVPVRALLRMLKDYKTSEVFRENLSYEITNELIQIKGSTFDSSLAWSHFKKYKETKKFFMFYHNHNFVTILDKEVFSMDDLTEFKKFIKSLDIKVV